MAPHSETRPQGGQETMPQEPLEPSGWQRPPVSPDVISGIWEDLICLWELLKSLNLQPEILLLLCPV